MCLAEEVRKTIREVNRGIQFAEQTRVRRNVEFQIRLKTINFGIAKQKSVELRLDGFLKIF
jgi:hypothetical protein